MKGRKKIFHASGKQKREGIVISDKIGFKSQTVTWEKGDYIMINGSLHQEDRTLIFAYLT